MEGYVIADMMMMQLGSFRFGVSTAAYQELTRSTRFRWPGQDLLGQAPALQFTGEEAEAMTLAGVVYPEYRGGGGQVEQLRALAAEGLPCLMVDGQGGILGRWVIEGLEEKQSIFAAAGLPRKQEFTLNLKRFGDATLAQMFDADALVSSGAFDVPGTAVDTLLQGAAGNAGQALAGLEAAATAIQSAAGAAMAALGPVRQAMTYAANLKATAADAQRVVKSLGNIDSLATAEQALGGIMRVSGSVAAASSTGAGTLKRVAADVAGESAPIIAAVQAGMLAVNRLAITATSVRTGVDKILRTFS